MSAPFQRRRYHNMYLSRNSWKRSDSVSPVTSTTFGTSVLGPFALLLGTLAPTTSSSANPSMSLFAPALSEGGARGREEERTRCDRFSLPISLEGVGAASELRTASKREDMVGGMSLYAIVGWRQVGLKIWRGETRRAQHAKPIKRPFRIAPAVHSPPPLLGLCHSRHLCFTVPRRGLS